MTYTRSHTRPSQKDLGCVVYPLNNKSLAACHKFDMVWLHRSPIPVGSRGVISSWMISTCLRYVWGGGGSVRLSSLCSTPTFYTAIVGSTGIIMHVCTQQSAGTSCLWCPLCRGRGRRGWRRELSQRWSSPRTRSSSQPGQRSLRFVRNKRGWLKGPGHEINLRKNWKKGQI